MKATNLARTVLVLVTSLFFGLAGFAAADYVDEIEVTGKSNVDVKTVKVTFGDLNLANEQGAQALYRRLEQASKMVCDVAGSKKTRLHEMNAEAQHCYRTVLWRSVERLDKALVTGIHEGQ